MIKWLIKCLPRRSRASDMDGLKKESIADMHKRAPAPIILDTPSGDSSRELDRLNRIDQQGTFDCISAGKVYNRNTGQCF